MTFYENLSMQTAGKRRLSLGINTLIIEADIISFQGTLITEYHIIINIFIEANGDYKWQSK